MAVKPIVTYDYTDQLNDDDVFIAAGEQVNTINALNASSDINNKVFGGYDAEASDSRIKSTIDDALSYAVDTRVAAYSSGDIAHITNGIKNGLFKSIKTSFNPIQKNKYDTTWIGGGGINKMPSIVRATKTGGGTSSITCQVITGGGVVRLTGEQGSTVTTTFRLDFKDDEKRVKLPGNSTWQPPLYLHLNNSVADSKITVSLLYTSSSSTGGQRFDVTLDAQNKVSRINTYGIGGARLNRIEIFIRSQSVNLRLVPMITLSEENEAWRPFSNVCAIDGYSSVTFTRCGKNLLEDPQNVTVEAQKDEWTKYPICVLPLLPKGTYRLSYTQDKDITTNYYNRIVYAENGYSKSCPASLDSGRHSVPITVRDSSQVKIEWEARNVSDECHITDFQLEYADASSEYSEYEGDTYSVEFKIAGTNKKEYRGSFDLITGELVVTGTLVTLGDYNWRYNAGNKTFRCDRFADVIKTGRNKYATDILCSSYTPYFGSGSISDKKIIRANLKNGYIYIYDPDYAFFGADPTAQEIINRQNEFKASLASTTMFIPFAEPSIHRYSPETVKLFLGINNIWSDIGDIDVTYPLDLKAYVDHAIGQYSVQTVRGPIAHYTNNFKKIPTKSVKVDIEPVQDLHGYDRPWVGGGGKNILSYPYASATGVYSGITYTDNLDGTITANGTATSTAYFDLVKVTTPKDIKAGTYTYSVNGTGGRVNINIYTNGSWVNQGSATDGTPTTFTVQEDTTYYAFFAINSGVTVNNQKFHLQLETGSTATAYEPYSNICPITGWTGAKVTRTGKNLLDISNLRKGNFEGVPTNTNVSFDEYQPIKGGQTYVWSSLLSAISGRYLKFYDVNKTELSEISLYGTGAKTFSAPSNARYFRGMWYAVTGIEPTDIVADQIELGSTATDYEPYRGQTYNITFPSEAGTVYGGTLDVTSGVLTVLSVYLNMANIVEWNLQTDIGRVYTLRPDLAAWLDVSTPSQGLLCNRFKTVPFNTVYSGTENGVAISGGGALQFRIKGLTDNPESTRQDVYDYFAEHETYVVANLATPITYTLTPQEITSLLGTNNLWADTGDIEVKYLTHTEA